MDSTALATFLAVARHGSITAAAHELHTVQSNVTARVRHLESELRVELFERHSRGMSLTTAGGKLLDYAQRFRTLEAEARDALHDAGVIEGPLRLGSMESTAAVRLPKVLRRFHLAHPQVVLEVRTGPTADLLEQVVAHRLDAAFVAGPVAHPQLEAKAVFREELVLVSAQDGPSIGERMETDGLTAIVFRQGCSYRQRLEAQFASRGWLPFRRIEFGTVEGILGCVGANIGVTVLPRSVVERSAYRDELRCESFAPEPLWVETLFVMRRRECMGATLRAFANSLQGLVS
jgi:LysR family transcriptional regulator, cell division regulator